MRNALQGLSLFLVASAALAQPQAIFDPDDFVDPGQRGGAVFFVSRLVAGGAANYIDHYRPLHQGAGFVHVANSVYWSSFQFDFKHSEVRGTEQSAPRRVQMCNCSPPIVFPTPPSLESTPEAPLPGRRESADFSWYWTSGGGPAQPPVTLRYRLTLSRQNIETITTGLNNDEVTGRLSGHEQSLGLDLDTSFPVAGHSIFGSLQYGRISRSGTTDNRTQHELAYMSRFPAVPVKRVLLRATLAVGGVSGRGANGLNLVNPSFEAFWHHAPSRANVHLVWSPQSTRSGTGGWETHHQIALFVDRALFVKLFR